MSRAGGDDDLFVGPLAPFAGRFVRGERTGSIPAQVLADPAALAEVLGRYRSRAGGDRCAAASLWSQTYFGTLIVPAMTILLLRPEPLALGLGDMRVEICSEHAIPLAFAGMPERPPSAVASFESLVDGHLAALIASLACAGGLSPKLLWENAAWPLAYAMAQALHRAPACRPVVQALLGCRPGPPACRSAFAALAKTALADAPFKRRLCCLRHRVPGFTPCAGQCPAPPPPDRDAPPS